VILQQLGDGLVADANAVQLEQRGRQRRGALTRPAQRRLRVAARDRLDELLQPRPRFGMLLLVGTLPGTFAPNANDVAPFDPAARFVSARPHRADRQPGHTRDHRDATPADRVSFAASPQAPRSLVERRLHHPPVLANRLLLLGRHRKGRSRPPPQSRSLRSSDRVSFDRLSHSRALSGQVLLPTSRPLKNGSLGA